MSVDLLNRWEARLTAWAEYLASGGHGARVKISSAYSLVGRGRPAEGDGIPVHVGEALDTDALVRKLPPHLRLTVFVVYCEPGDNQGEKAARLGVHRDTLRDRIVAAKRALEDLRQARRAGITKRAYHTPQMG